MCIHSQQGFVLCITQGAISEAHRFDHYIVSELVSLSLSLVNGEENLGPKRWEQDHQNLPTP